MGSSISIINDVADADLFVQIGVNQQALGYAIAGLQLVLAIASGLRAPAAYNPLTDVLKVEGKLFFTILKNDISGHQQITFTASAVETYMKNNGGFSANTLDDMAYQLFSAYALGGKHFNDDGDNDGGLDLHVGGRNIGGYTGGTYDHGGYSLSLVLQANALVVKREGYNLYRLCRGHWTVWSGATADSTNYYHLSNQMDRLCSDSVVFSVTRTCPDNANCAGTDGTFVTSCKSPGLYVSNNFNCVPCPGGAATCDASGGALTCPQGLIYSYTDKTCFPCPVSYYNAYGNVCLKCPGTQLVSSCDFQGVATGCFYPGVLGARFPGSCDCADDQYIATTRIPPEYGPVNPYCRPCTDTGVKTCTGHLFPTTCLPNFHLDSGSGTQIGAGSQRCCREGYYSADDGFGDGATYADGTYHPGYFQEQFGVDPYLCRKCTGDYVSSCQFSQVYGSRATGCRIDKVLISPLNTTNMYAPALAPICADACPTNYFFKTPINNSPYQFACDRCAEGALTCTSASRALTCEIGTPYLGACPVADVAPPPLVPVPAPVPASQRARAKRSLMDGVDQLATMFNLCPSGETACPIHAGGGGFECLDVAASLNSCGGCLHSEDAALPGAGTDCLSIPGAMGVACEASQCLVSSCLPDWEFRDGGCIPKEMGFARLSAMLARRRRL